MNKNLYSINNFSQTIFQLFFEAQKMSGFLGLYIGFDEISVRQGSCGM